MLAALRSRSHSSISAALSRCSSLYHQTVGSPHPPVFFSSASASPSPPEKLGFLDVEEVQKILDDVKADDVRVIPVRDHCAWTDFMVIATGRSTWHVKNIAQALIYKVKQKQIGSKHMVLPSVEGHAEGNWVVIDSGTVIVHALDEKARAYYNLDSLWTNKMSTKVPSQVARMPDGPKYLEDGMVIGSDVEKAVVKTRRKNNSKKPLKSASKS